MWSQSLALYFKLRIGPEGNAIAATFLDDLLDLIQRRNASLVLVGDGPYFTGCNTDGWYGSEQRCTTTWAGGAAQRERMSIIYGGANLTDGALPSDVHFFDVPSYICDDGTCSNFLPAALPGTVLDTVAFYDEDHLTLAGSLYLWPHLCTFFREHGVLPTAEREEASGGL